MTLASLVRKTSLTALAVCAVALTSCATASNDPRPVDLKPDQMPKVPGLKSGKIKTLWIPDKIDGDRWEAGHYLFLLEHGTWEAK